MIRDTASLPPSAAASRAAPQAVRPPPAEATPRPATPMLNPRMRIDTELNLVVLEFRDEAGELSHSLPSPREIDAYRQAAQERRPADAERPAAAGEDKLL